MVSALFVVEFSVVFEGPSLSMWVIIEAVGTAVEAFGYIAEVSEHAVEVVCPSTANQVFSKRP
jgi:hypothetical protein